MADASSLREWIDERSEFILSTQPHRIAPQVIDAAISGRLQQPSRGVLRHSRQWPALHCLYQSILHRVFHELQVLNTEATSEDRNDPPRFATEICSTTRPTSAGSGLIGSDIKA